VDVRFSLHIFSLVKTFGVGLLVLFGCAKGTEIGQNEIVILELVPPDPPSAEAGSELQDSGMGGTVPPPGDLDAQAPAAPALDASLGEPPLDAGPDASPVTGVDSGP
jgi:hypothetical protein